MPSLRQCEADHACTHAVCFRGVLETAGIRRCAEVCAGHLVDMITALMAWAASRGLGDARVTVLAIPPVHAEPAQESVFVASMPVRGAS